jgi:hypothetical protein
MSVDRPASWGQLAFGLPVYIAPPTKDPKTITLRNKLNGISVQDGAVGGGTVCATGTGFWSEWGDKSNPGSEKNADINIQNQTDVGDWPCFSKYYITIPLDSLPSGKAVLSAKLILHQFGNSGGGEWGEPPSSLIQVFSYLYCGVCVCSLIGCRFCVRLRVEHSKRVKSSLSVSTTHGEHWWNNGRNACAHSLQARHRTCDSCLSLLNSDVNFQLSRSRRLNFMIACPHSMIISSLIHGRMMSTRWDMLQSP